MSPESKLMHIDKQVPVNLDQGILAFVGNTPLVPLEAFLGPCHFRLFAKLEALNPGGSIKDRAAVSILRHALDEGLITRGTVVVESSSGNMGIGLAMACARLKIKFVCVVDPKTTTQNLDILRAFGAQIDMVRDVDPSTGEYLPMRIKRVETLLKEIPDAFWPNQYANIFNARAHHQTMLEVVRDLGRTPDFLFCATSSCGTLRGVSDFARLRGYKTCIVAVDALGSRIFDSPVAKRLIPGMGAARRPELFKPGLADRCVHVTDCDCVIGCRRLVREEAILAGGSSGGVLMAVEKIRDSIPADATCVAILCDRGDRYLDTIYSDEWVETHFNRLHSKVDVETGSCHQASCCSY